VSFNLGDHSSDNLHLSGFCYLQLVYQTCNYLTNPILLFIQINLEVASV
jgi:hypothetical protein